MGLHGPATFGSSERRSAPAVLSLQNHFLLHGLKEVIKTQAWHFVRRAQNHLSSLVPGRDVQLGSGHFS